MRQDPRFSSVFVVDHPLVQHKLTHMRDKTTSTRTFRQLLREITLLMGYEATRHLPLTSHGIETPITSMQAPIIAGKKLVLVPILRAGTVMAEGLLELIPSARVGHVGLYRDENHRPVEYIVRLPELEGRSLLVCDPMIGTGHSAVHAVDVLKKRGVAARDIQFLALVAAPEGLRTYTEAHPDVPMFVAAIDEYLNDHAYIVPGLGDAGDRLFGTKN